MPVAPRTLASEIQGYSELGMKTEALALCRRALQLKRLDASMLAVVLDSVDQFTVQRRRWIAAIEAAYGRLSARERRWARFSLMVFEAELRRYVQVLRLAHRRYRREDARFELSMVAEAAYFTREWHILRTISKRLRKATEETTDEVLRPWMDTLVTFAERAEKLWWCISLPFWQGQ